MGLGPISGTIAVVGTGVIGASWSAYFLAKGFDVAATDPADGAEKRLRTLVDGFWPALEHIGLAAGASRSRLRFDPHIVRAVEGCEFIQENGPERVDVKRDLLTKISAAAPSDSLIATSSSGILISDIQDAAAYPQRVLLGHPFNPPHLIPLVEVAGGRMTSENAINKALTFYGSIGKKPIHLRRKSFRDTARVLGATRYMVGWMSTGCQMAPTSMRSHTPSSDCSLESRSLRSR